MVFNYSKYKEILYFLSKNKEKNVELISISKNHPAEDVHLAIKEGVTIFGENKVQEAIGKFHNIKKENANIRLHLTGPLQSNKVKKALEIFDVFHTLDREKLAKEISKFKYFLKNKNFFIQVNTGKEISKSGIYPEEVNAFVNYCRLDLNIPVFGLMCIPPISEKPKDHFELLYKVARENNLPNLSMGMSSDYEEAVLCGATHIRVGTKIFGLRK